MAGFAELVGDLCSDQLHLPHPHYALKILAPHLGCSLDVLGILL